MRRVEILLEVSQSMRKIVLLIFLLLACTAWLVAQQGENPPAASGQSVEGCLGGSAGSFTVMDKAGTTYMLQLPQGADTAKLGQHIGEEVRVTGTMSDAGSASAASATKAAAQPTINVSKMDKIGDTCNNSQAAPSK